MLSKYLKNGTMYLEEWFKCIEISIYLPHSINTGVEITYQHLVGGNMCDQLTYWYCGVGNKGWRSNKMIIGIELICIS